VFRAVTVPCDDAALCSAVDAALSRHVEVEASEAVAEHLQFGKEVALRASRRSSRSASRSRPPRWSGSSSTPAT
jgi:hypothetical protein